MTRFWLILAGSAGLLLALWWTGWLGFPSSTSSVPAASTPEATWDEQVSAARAGANDRIEVTKEIISNDQLLHLKGLTKLRELLIDQGDVTTAGLASLTTLENLEHLRIRGARINDDGFREICSIGSLRRLNLPQADLTDEGLAAVTNLKQLELLRLGSPRVTDAGIEAIGRVTTLRWLHLIDIPLTGESLKSIAELNNLESLYLDGAQISDAAYESFFRSRPDLHVHIDQRHHDRDPHKTGHAH